MTTPSDSVRIVLISEDSGQFLVLCEKDDIDNWKLPGGRFENDESPEVAAQRELKEELGLDCKLTFCAELLNDDGVSKRFIFSSSIEPSTIEPSDEIAEVLWCSDKTLPKSKNRSHILAALKQAKNISIPPNRCE